MSTKNMNTYPVKETDNTDKFLGVNSGGQTRLLTPPDDYASISASLDTGVVSTSHLRQVNASSDSTASGTRSQVNASSDSTASVVRSQVNASLVSTASGSQSQVNASSDSEASGNRSQVNASSDSTALAIRSQVNASHASTASGDQSQVNASSDSTASVFRSQVNASSGSEASGYRSQVNASSDSEASVIRSQVNASHASTASGSQSQVNASSDSEASGSRSQVNACTNSQASGVNSSVSASELCTASGSSASVKSSISCEAAGLQSDINGSFLCKSTEGASQINVSSRVLNNTLYSSAWGRSTSGDTLEANQTIRLESIGGNIRATGTIDNPWTDYAELFENKEDGEIEAGYLIALDGKKVRKAQEGDDIDGVSSRTYNILGGEHFSCWHGRYLHDEFGARVWEEIDDPDYEEYIEREVTETKIRKETKLTEIDGKLVEDVIEVKYEEPVYETLQVFDRDGNAVEVEEIKEKIVKKEVFNEETGKKELVEEIQTEVIKVPKTVKRIKMEKVKNPTPQTKIRVQKESPKFDPKKAYKSRQERLHEWTPVGLLGQVYVRVDKTVQVGDKVKAGNGGIGTKGTEHTGLRCLSIEQKYDTKKGYAIAICLINVQV